MARRRNVDPKGELRVQTIEEWLAAGNKITICPPGMRSEDVVEKQRGRTRGRKKKKAE